MCTVCAAAPGPVAASQCTQGVCRCASVCVKTCVNSCAIACQGRPEASRGRYCKAKDMNAAGLGAARAGAAAFGGFEERVAKGGFIRAGSAMCAAPAAHILRDQGCTRGGGRRGARPRRRGPLFGGRCAIVSGCGPGSGARAPQWGGRCILRSRECVRRAAGRWPHSFCCWGNRGVAIKRDG